MENKKVKQEKSRVTHLVSVEVIQKFNKKCDENLQPRSRVIQMLMEKFLKDERKD